MSAPHIQPTPEKKQCQICLERLHDKEHGEAVITTSHDNCMEVHMHYRCWSTWNDHHPNECVICRKKSVAGNTYTTWNPLSSGQPHITVLIGNDHAIPRRAREQSRDGICHEVMVFFCSIILLSYFIASMMNSMQRAAS